MGAASSNPKGDFTLSANLWIPPWKKILGSNHLTASGLDRLWVTGRTVKERLRTAQAAVLQEDKVSDQPLSHCISLFLPEFPVWSPVGQPQLKVLGCVAKGSIGPVLKVLDCSQQKVLAVKVLPKGEIIRRNTVKQCKEEVSIQRHVKHPFIQCFGESWQGQRHLFIMCSYCSFGDLYSLWLSFKCMDEGTVRLFAAELVSVLVYLHDLGIVHRDVKMENILLDERGHLKLTDFGYSRQLSFGEHAYTICGTLKYMAPEVLSGGPYNHSADWWSLGVLIFALASGEFPVAQERDHLSMLESITQATYDLPKHLSSGLGYLLKELLCKDPRLRLRYFHQFKCHPFFKGISFDPVLLQKSPVNFVLSMRKSEMTNLEDTSVFEDFDCELLENENILSPV